MVLRKKSFNKFYLFFILCNSLCSGKIEPIDFLDLNIFINRAANIIILPYCFQDIPAQMLISFMISVLSLKLLQAFNCFQFQSFIFSPYRLRKMENFNFGVSEISKNFKHQQLGYWKCKSHQPGCHQKACDILFEQLPDSVAVICYCFQDIAVPR